MPFSGPLPGPITVPVALRRLVGAAQAPCVWRNELGGLTFRVGDDDEALYVKWSPAASGLDVAGEVARLGWASPTIAVPEVVATGADDEGAWFVSRALAGENAVSPRWRADPAAAVRAIGRGLREMHDVLDVARCPFSWRRADRLSSVQSHAATGALDSTTFGFEFTGLALAAALEELRVGPDEDLVVCHGDACAPNTLIDEDGRCAGHVDLGALGVGDRWADLAVAAWSTVWNYGPGWEEPLYAAYGIAPDPTKIRYYRLLWSLG